jgi:hypothetical protein
VVAAIGTLFGGALILAVVDLYLGGHGARPLANRHLLDADALGIHVSVADGILLALVALVALSTAFGDRPTP